MKLLVRLTAPVSALVVLIGMAGCEPTRVLVENTPPEAAILAPESGSEIWEGRPIMLRGQAGDRLSDLTDLTASWSSSLDGQLYEGHPDAEGVTETEVPGLSVGTHEIILRVVDLDGASTSDRVGVVVQDDLPPAITILEPSSGALLPPDTPFSLLLFVEDGEDASEELRINIRTAEGTVLTEGLAPASDGSAAVSLNLEPGDWDLLAEVHDSLGQTAQDTVLLEVEARDETPTIDGVRIQPDPLRVGDTASCSYDGFEAPPGAADLSTISWFISGEDAGGGPELGAGFVGGDLVQCTVTPRTPTLSGVPVSAELRVANSLPTIDSLALTPAAPTTQTLLQATTTTSDPDGDTVVVRWSWQVNGTDVEADESTLDGRSFFERGDTVRVIATPADGSEDGLPATAEVVVENLPPVPAEAHIEPPEPARLDALTCTIDIPGSDLDASDELSTGIAWLLDGTETPYIGPVLAAERTSDGDEWACVVTVTDGTAEASSTSPAVVVSSVRNICSLEVDASLDGEETCTVAVPVDGLLRIELDNPDASADGVFRIDLGSLGVHWLFTGYRDWAYDGTVVEGWAEATLEVSLSAADGPLSALVSYEASHGLAPSGFDRVDLSFAYYESLDTATATLLSASVVGPTDTTPTNVTAALEEGERLLMELTSCGFGGGGHGLYAENDGATGNDGILRIDTGWGDSCNAPLRSMTLPPGSYLFSMVQEDDLLSDNSEERGLRLYRYLP